MKLSRPTLVIAERCIAPSCIARSIRPSRTLRCSARQSAIPYPATVTGPAPPAPPPPASLHRENVERRQKQAQLLQRGQDLRSSQSKTRDPLKKRFWKDVHVRTEPDGSHSIHLDTRPLRTPSKTPLLIPASKLHLASALALEWSLLTSNQQARQHHLIPLTSLCSRALDLAAQDDDASSSTPHTTRADIVATMMRYFDTDTLLCWSPTRSAHDAAQLEQSAARGAQTLRELQVRTTLPIVSFLIERVWPGVEIRPILEADSIVPAAQPPATRDVVRGWVSGLGAWELAGLERAVLASKSFCVGARLMVEWSEALRDLKGGAAAGERAGGGAAFGVEEAAEACSLEVRWQTGMWGEVEDSHDVEREDVRRQLGSAVLLVSGG